MIQSDKTGKCASVPKNVWFEDSKYGGNLGTSTTLAKCEARGWAGFCGTTAHYMIPQGSSDSPSKVKTNHYCSNRVCFGGSCSESVQKTKLADCAAAVKANPNCGDEFNHGNNDGWCDCVAPWKSCVAKAFNGYTTYKLQGYLGAPTTGCYVKIQSDKTGKCANVPKNVWFEDGKYGGNLGPSTTTAQCAARGWAGYCGTTAQYAVSQPATPAPTEHPSRLPTHTPTEHPTTKPPSPSPSHTPTEHPSRLPTHTPTEHPTKPLIKSLGGTDYYAVAAWPITAWGAWPTTAGDQTSCVKQTATSFNGPVNLASVPHNSKKKTMFVQCCNSAGIGQTRDCATTQGKTHAQAKAYCDGKGMRLCSKAELLKTWSKGCSVDGVDNRAWSSDSCAGGAAPAPPPAPAPTGYLIPSSEGAACPAGYTQVSAQSECQGAATAALKASGKVNKWLSSGTWSDHVGGCFEGYGSWNGNPGNGNVHFSTRPLSYTGGTRGYRICKGNG
jgi:hypothetical protein